MKKSRLCPYKKLSDSNNLCPYKKGFLAFYKHLKGNTSCLDQNKKDYQNSHSGNWLNQKVMVFYKSTCPMVSGNWWKHIKSKK